MRQLNRVGICWDLLVVGSEFDDGRWFTEYELVAVKGTHSRFT